MPLSQDVVDDAIRSIKASVLLIRTTQPQWPIQSRSIQLLKETNPNVKLLNIVSFSFRNQFYFIVSNGIHRRFTSFSYDAC